MIKKIEPSLAKPLRQLVLRPDLRVEDLDYPGDLEDDSLHLGFFKDDDIIGIVSMYKRACSRFDLGPNCYHLRGMAVAPNNRTHGVGKELVKECISLAKKMGATHIWCNARTSATDFYIKQGFTVDGEVFDIKDVGPHLIAFIQVN